MFTFHDNKEREWDRGRERETDRETDRQTERETDRSVCMTHQSVGNRKRKFHEDFKHRLLQNVLRLLVGEAQVPHVLETQTVSHLQTSLTSTDQSHIHRPVSHPQTSLTSTDQSHIYRPSLTSTDQSHIYRPSLTSTDQSHIYRDPVSHLLRPSLTSTETQSHIYGDPVSHLQRPSLTSTETQSHIYRPSRTSNALLYKTVLQSGPGGPEPGVDLLYLADQTVGHVSSTV